MVWEGILKASEMLGLAKGSKVEHSKRLQDYATGSRYMLTDFIY